MTSEAIEESGVKVFMFALALGIGKGALTLRIRYQQMRTNQRTSENSNRAGERQHDVFKQTNSVYYSFTLSSAQSGEPGFASHFAPSVCGAHHRLAMR